MRETDCKFDACCEEITRFRQMLDVSHADNNRGIVQRAKMIDAQQCLGPWLFDASMASFTQTLALHSHMADRYGMAVEIVMRAYPNSADWHKLRQRLNLACFRNEYVMVHSKGPAAVTSRITPSLTTTDIEEGYVRIS
jgi:hypothetical protein